MNKIIPLPMWKISSEEEMTSQPGVKLSINIQQYEDAYDWARELFGEDLRCALWWSYKTPNSFWIFAHHNQMLMFKLRWGGR